MSYFVLLHLFFPSSWPSSIKNGIDALFTNPLGNWLGIIPFIGLMVVLMLVIYYGIHFLASFGSGFNSKTNTFPEISILIASKNEKILLESTLNSIIQSNYPKEKIQIIVVLSGPQDDSIEYCQEFTDAQTTIDIKILSDVLPKKGKPPALNHGLKYAKNEIIILYDSGCILQPDTLKNLVAPFQKKEIHAVIGPVLVKNWKKNKITKGIFLDYGIVSGGGLLFEIKNRLGSSAYSFGRNLAVSKKTLLKYGGFNEDSLTEDLYLSVLLNLDGIIIRYAPKAKVYEYVPETWEILKKQRTRWLAGYTADAPQLMSMKSEIKDGKFIIISRNLTMMLIGNIDTWMPIVIGLVILHFLIGDYYMLLWSLSCLFFQFGYLFNSIRKYCDKHYSLLFYFLVSGYIHLFMFLHQFKLPKELSWEKTPMLLEKQEAEIIALSTITTTK
ncbi:MAG: glycosyltransferase [Promethearchaeota archaeon]